MGGAPYGIADLVLGGFVRVVTHPGIFKVPTAGSDALEFAEEIRNQPNRVSVAAGSRHWKIFTRLCREHGARGALVPDCYLAAMAIESGCEWITTDRDFARFADLKQRHPLRSRGQLSQPQ